jgi:DNA-binding XRE family transcriptional regulator
MTSELCCYRVAIESLAAMTYRNGAAKKKAGTASVGVPVEVDVERVLADMGDVAQWDWDAASLGPGSYRAPEVGAQLAEAVSAYRAERGLTQGELGGMVGLHQSQIARMEAGQHTPSTETLVRLARHLRLSVRLEVTPAGASVSFGGETARTG